MISPLGTTLANAFLCNHEKNWLNVCPPPFKPVVYRRYVDIFALFKYTEHLIFFVSYIHLKHKSINTAFKIFCQLHSLET